jgi:hypothetical protein
MTRCELHRRVVEEEEGGVAVEEEEKEEEVVVAAAAAWLSPLWTRAALESRASESSVL